MWAGGGGGGGLGFDYYSSPGFGFDDLIMPQLLDNLFDVSISFGLFPGSRQSYLMAAGMWELVEYNEYISRNMFYYAQNDYFRQTETFHIGEHEVTLTSEIYFNPVTMGPSADISGVSVLSSIGEAIGKTLSWTWNHSDLVSIGLTAANTPAKKQYDMGSGLDFCYLLGN